MFKMTEDVTERVMRLASNTENMYNLLVATYNEMDSIGELETIARLEYFKEHKEKIRQLLHSIEPLEPHWQE